MSKPFRIFDRKQQEKETYDSHTSFTMHNIILIYDVTNRSTFENISKWFDAAKKQKLSSSKVPENHDIVFVLVGNKIDISPRAVEHQEACVR